VSEGPSNSLFFPAPGRARGEGRGGRWLPPTSDGRWGSGRAYLVGAPAAGLLIAISGTATAAERLPTPGVLCSAAPGAAPWPSRRRGRWWWPPPPPTPWLAGGWSPRAISLSQALTPLISVLTLAIVDLGVRLTSP